MSKFFRWFNKDKQQTTPESTDEKQVENHSTDSGDIVEETEQPIERLETDDVPESNGSDLTHSIDESGEDEPSQIATEHELQQVTQSSPEFEEEIVPVEVSQVESEPELLVTTEAQPEPIEADARKSEVEPELESQGFFTRLKQGLSRTKQNIGSGFANLFKGKAIDDELFEELETQLLVADLGMDTTTKIITHLTESADRSQLKDGEALYDLLKQQMSDMLQNIDTPLDIENDNGPFVILMVGVNGVGKTTTIGKMAKQFQMQGKKVMLAAGDTFRAAAVEQLQVWGERNDIPVVAQQTGSDSASVIFDAFQSAQAKNVDVLIADTAGRLQNKDHLMEELKKVVRVMKKINPQAPHEIMLTLDAGTGQNAVSQAKLFNEAVGLTGLTLTKLDGTAKGGVIFAIADKFNIPIRFIGVGEGIDDLRPFNGEQFVDALFSENQ